ncbi:MAG TPA: GcrA family cell cycle regulator [Caulobacteraceae bacterium]
MEWTEERIEALTKMWREGLSASQVARQLGGVSRSAVIGKVHRLGIAGRDAPSRPPATVARPSTRIRASAGGVRRLAAPRGPQQLVPAAPRAIFEASATATIHTLTESGCRWPIGEPDEAGFGFCGRLRLGGGSYCAGHAPMSTRRRDTPMKTKEIDRIVHRFVEGGYHDRAASDFSWREIA